MKDDMKLSTDGRTDVSGITHSIKI